MIVFESLIAEITVSVGAIGAFLVALRSIKKEVKNELVSRLAKSEQGVKRDITKKLEQSEKAVVEQVGAVVTRINGFFDVMLDAMDYPAWVKRVERTPDGKIEFVMHHANEEYADWFGVSNYQYAGKTDYDVWPDDTADSYYAHDSMTLAQQKGSRFQEPVSAPLAGRGTSHIGKVMEFEKLYLEHKGVEFIVGFMRPVEIPPDMSL